MTNNSNKNAICKQFIEGKFIIADVAKSIKLTVLI